MQDGRTLSYGYLVFFINQRQLLIVFPDAAFVFAALQVVSRGCSSAQ